MPLLDGGSLAFCYFWNVESSCIMVRNLTGEILVDWIILGLPLLHLTLWLLKDMYCADRGSPPLSVRQWWAAHSHSKILPAVLE